MVRSCSVKGCQSESYPGCGISFHGFGFRQHCVFHYFDETHEMLEPWNDSSLLPPPVHTSTCLDGSTIDIKQLAHACSNIIAILTKQSPLHNEAAILARFIYKYDKKFRNDIGYRNFKKVNTALKKYLTLNLLKHVDSFTAALPGDDDEYLPTRQMLQFVLVRIMTFGKVLVRICSCAKQACVFYLDRLKRGESHWMSLMPYALLSRIWSLTMILLRHSCTWYSNLFPFSNTLPLKGLPFLPEHYKLPEDLEYWLGMSQLDNFGRFEWTQKKKLDIDAGLIEDKDGDMFDNILEYVNQINSEDADEIQMENPKIITENLDNKESIKIPSLDKMDQGEIISRDTFKNILKGLKPEEKVVHYAERVTNKDTLDNFIKTEERLRNEGSAQCLTSHLSFMQWLSLRKALTQLYASLTNNRKIERKFKKIWKEKCLDCRCSS